MKLGRIYLSHFSADTRMRVIARRKILMQTIDKPLQISNAHKIIMNSEDLLLHSTSIFCNLALGLGYLVMLNQYKTYFRKNYIEKDVTPHRLFQFRITCLKGIGYKTAF